jgi:hypothetical protein
MNPDHAYFAQWDAAFVVGALSPTERREFEDHLADCAECQRAVAALSPTVALLSQVSPERAESIDAEPAGNPVAADGGVGGPDSSVREVVVSLGRRRMRRRRVWWAAAAAAVALVIAAVAIPVSISRMAPTSSFALESVADVPLEASVELSSVAWGTRIELECRYTRREGSDIPAEGWPYVLTVVSVDGATTDVSTWRAEPGSTARLSAGTALDVDEIGAIEIRGIASGDVLMRYELDDRTAP